MNILHLQTGLPTSGNAAFRLHSALLNYGINSKMLMHTSNRSANEHIHILSDPLKNFKIVANRKLEQYKLRRQTNGSYSFSYPFLGNNVSDSKLIKNADLIILHWCIGGFLNLRNIEQLAKTNKPIIIFMHDMWAITGGCHHSFECEKYTSTCKRCGMFYPIKEHDPAYSQFIAKKRLYFSYPNIRFASPSQWLFGCMKKASLLKGKELFHLPNIINSDVFTKIDKNEARRIFRIDEDKIVLTFGTKVGVQNDYKGWSYMKEALVLLKETVYADRIVALIFGSEYNEDIIREVPFKTYFTGALFDDIALSMVYNASDIYVSPTLADNYPSTILESQSCGVPVVAFNVGGVSDLIMHKENGYLALLKDAADIKEGIVYCLDNKINGELISELQTENLIPKYLEVFKKLI